MALGKMIKTVKMSKMMKMVNMAAIMMRMRHLRRSFDDHIEEGEEEPGMIIDDFSTM